MDKEEIASELKEIEKDLRDIYFQCMGGKYEEKSFNGIFLDHGIAKGTHKTFSGYVDSFNNNFNGPRRKLVLDLLVDSYKGAIIAFSGKGHNYPQRTMQIAKKVYTDERDANHITKRLLQLVEKSRETPNKQLDKLLIAIKTNSRKLMSLAEEMKLFQRMITIHFKHLSTDREIITNGGMDEDELRSFWKSEVKAGNNFAKDLLHLGTEAADIVKSIYNYDRYAYSIFLEMKRIILSD